MSEFLTVSLLAKKLGLPVVPHVGDMGQLHQHLVLFNHIALGQEVLFLEHVPHLRDQFVFPALVNNGRYQTPEEPGASCDLKLAWYDTERVNIERTAGCPWKIKDGSRYV